MKVKERKLLLLRYHYQSIDNVFKRTDPLMVFRKYVREKTRIIAQIAYGFLWPHHELFEFDMHKSRRDRILSVHQLFNLLISINAVLDMVPSDRQRLSEMGGEGFDRTIVLGKSRKQFQELFDLI